MKLSNTEREFLIRACLAAAGQWEIYARTETMPEAYRAKFAALGSSVPAMIARLENEPPTTKRVVKSYNVKIIPRRPSCTDSGQVFEIHACNKAEAISKARALHEYDRHDGALVFSAVEI